VIRATTLASLSADLEICKQMFSYGAIKPLLNVSDGSKTNEACMLAGLGCVIQLCRYLRLLSPVSRLFSHCANSGSVLSVPLPLFLS
jgi:hypothetical protein